MNINVFADDQVKYFISSNSVRVKSTPEATGKNLGELSLNDEVRIVNPEIIYNQKYVEIIILLTYDPIIKSEKYFINKDYLSSKIIDYKEFVGKYFVVVNVASERIRLYERVCNDNLCPNKMLMESEIVVGEDVNHPKEEKGKGRSILGSYRLTGWSKFYQDPEGHYPAWYRDGYPEPPSPEASWHAWFSNKVMPPNAEGKHHGIMRGAFGWYTAFAAPEPFGQWTHGTLGWGSDKDKFIKKVKKTLINVVSNPRSSGCTRNNNEAIAFLRRMIDVGTPLIKVYAAEEIFDPTLSNYPKNTEEWKYILTKSRSHLVDRAEVVKSLAVSESDVDVYWEAKKSGAEIIIDPKSPLNQILEVGSYEIDTHPDAIAYSPGEDLSKFKRKLGRSGNVYGIKSSDMHGVFYVDTGMLKDYGHPTSVLEVSGFSDEVTPAWMNFNNLKK